MPTQDLLILAVTKMLGGVCIAGMTSEPDPVTGLRWVRPIREYGHVLLGDITTPDQEVLRPFDVVRFNLIRPHPHRPTLKTGSPTLCTSAPALSAALRASAGQASWTSTWTLAPLQVLKDRQRSLCLIKPSWVKGCFHLDAS